MVSPGTRVECKCPRAKHKHGEVQTYRRCGCRCGPCSYANSQLRNDLKVAHENGTYVDALVDAGPVYEHLAKLGLGSRALAAVSGVPETTCASLLWGRRNEDGGVNKPDRIDHVNAKKLLAVTGPPPPHARTLVDGRGTRRRLQAVMAMGWSGYYIAEKLSEYRGKHTTRQHVTKLLSANLLREETRLAVDRLYREHAFIRPAGADPGASRYERQSYSRCISYSKAQRWVTAAAWDDIDRDDHPPGEFEGDEEYVDQAAVLRRVAGERIPLNDREQEEVVRHMRAFDPPATYTFIEKHTGLNIERIKGRIRHAEDRERQLQAERERLLAALHQLLEVRWGRSEAS